MDSDEKTQSRLQRPELPDDWLEAQKSYCVMLDEVGTGVETPESFAIKFSLLTRIPITKTKHIMKRLPARVWAGSGRRKAEHILSLIEEAGGLGRVIEEGSRPPEPVSAEGASKPDAPAPPKPLQTCRWCGFPLKEGDSFCEFCMKPVQEEARGGGHAASTGKRIAVPRRRLVLYFAILIAGIIVYIVIRYS
jgi:hypothetical protein